MKMMGMVGMVCVCVCVCWRRDLIKIFYNINIDYYLLTLILILWVL